MLGPVEVIHKPDDDRIQFNLVCKRWRIYKYIDPQLVWLMLPYDPNCPYLRFYDMREGKVRKLNLPRYAQGGTNVDDLQLFLYDPISRAQLSLPPLSTISHFEDSFGDKVSGWNPAVCIIAQVDASSSDASQCIVVATFVTYSSILALCRPNGERWTIVEGLLADGFYYGNFLFFDEELYGYRLSMEPDRVNNINEAPDFQTHSITLGNQGDREKLKLICNTPPPTWLLYAEDADGLTKYHRTAWDGHISWNQMANY
ncbi:hypothetical protein GOBAR_DD28251 [Gossypium barbadense]|nr:hypothetical protein GOBAR_DD28251 [Gossypium barbadense]